MKQVQAPHKGTHPRPPRSSHLHDLFENHLTRLGLRQTKQRRAILDAVLELGSHVDAETIAFHARKFDKNIGMATVYRTLQLMTEAQIIVERQFRKDRSQFELADEEDCHHDHLICTHCGHIIEFFDQQVEKLQEAIAQRLGFRLTNHRMELFGSCLEPQNCKKREQKKA